MSGEMQRSSPVDHSVTSTNHSNLATALTHIRCICNACTVKPLITDSPKGRQPLYMPPIALPIEIVHLEPLSSGHLSTPDNGQPACPQRTAIYTNNLQKRTETETASIDHKNTIKFLTFVTQIVCPLLCFVDFCPCRACLIETC